MTELASLGIKIEASDIKQAVAELDRLENQSGKTEKATHGLNKSFFDLKSALASLGVIYLTKQLIDNVNTYQQLENQLRLVTSSSEELVSVQSRLFQVAQETYVGLEGTIDIYSRFSRSTKELNLSSEQLAAITTTVNQALAISGASATSANAAIVQFGQGLSSGTLRGQELNSIMEQTPRLAQALAEGLGVGIGQLRAMGEAGELTGVKLVAALQNQSSVVAAEFGQTEKTVSQAMQQIENVILQTFGSINSDELIDSLDTFRATISDPKMVEDLTHLAEGLLTVATLTIQVAAKIGEVTQHISEATQVTAEWFAAYNAGQITFFEWLVTGTEGASKRLDEIQAKLYGVADANTKATETPASKNATPENIIIPGLPMPTDEQIQEWLLMHQGIAQLEMEALRETESEKQLIELESQETRRMNLLQFYSDEETYASDKAEKLKLIRDKELADQISRGESGFSTMIGQMASHNKTFFQIQKLYRISKLAMETPAAVWDSYVWANSWGGPAAGVTAAGLTAAAAIGYASQLAGANYGGSGSASAGGGQNAVTGPVSPGVTTLFPQDQQQEARGATTIIINGTIIGHEDYINNTMLPLIKTAISERDYVLVEANSLNGLELSA